MGFGKIRKRRKWNQPKFEIMDKAYYLTDPSAIDERYFQKVLQSPCNGVAVTDAATGEVLCHTYSAFVLAIITRAHGHLNGVFWKHGGGLLPLKEFLLEYKAGYVDGRNTFSDFAGQINNGEMSAAEVLKTIHRKGREAKAKCAAPLPLSIGSIRETGFHTGQAVEASYIIHKNPAVFGQVFGIPLACAPGWCVFEFAEPLDCKPLISIMDADTGTRLFDLSAKTPVDRERQSIQMHSFIGNREWAFAEAREHLVSEAERYNRTDAKVHGYPVNEKVFTEHTLQNNHKATIRMDFLPGNKVTVNLDESLCVPPHIDVRQAIKYHSHIARQAEAAKKEFLQNSIPAKAETPAGKKHLATKPGRPKDTKKYAKLATLFKEKRAKNGSKSDNALCISVADAWEHYAEDEEGRVSAKTVKRAVMEHRQN